MYDKLQQSSQVLHDPIVDVVEDICSQSPSPLVNYELQNKDDMDLIRQLVSLSCSVGISLQSSSKNLQSASISLENDKLHFIKQPMSKKEEDSSIVVHHQEKVVIHEFQDPFVKLW